MLCQDTLPPAIEFPTEADLQDGLAPSCMRSLGPALTTVSPYPRVKAKSQTYCLSIVAYCIEHNTGSIPSFTLTLGGEERSTMRLVFFGD